MGTCSDRLTDAQRTEITELLAAPLEKRMRLLMTHYGMCEDCAMHVMVTSIIVLFKCRQGSTMTAEDAINAFMHGITKVYDIPVVSFNSKEEMDKFVQHLESGNNKSKLH